MGGTSAVLEVKSLGVRFGGLKALDEASLEVRPGARHGVLGPNGAGKTTLFNAISGFVKPWAGSIRLKGRDIRGMPPHRRASLGLGRTFQITTLLGELTALENVLLGTLVAVGHHRSFWRSARGDQRARKRAEKLLTALGLGELGEAKVRSLGYGQQRQLEIAAALATEPDLLLLDEPTAGLSAAETRSVLELIDRLPPELTLVIIEHDLEVVFRIANELTVLHHGRVLADGPAHQVRKDPVVREVYLGE